MAPNIYDPKEFEPKVVTVPLLSVYESLPWSNRRTVLRQGTKTWREAETDHRFIKPEKLDRLKPEPWLVTDSDFPNALRHAIEIEILPSVERLSSLRDYMDEELKVAFISESSIGSYLVTFGEAAHGNFRLAANRAKKDPWHHVAKCFNAFLPGLGDRLEAMGDELPSDDKRAIIKMLHEREAAAIKFLKLEKYWEPAPFPAEEMGLV